jgi:hypothetical protein
MAEAQPEIITRYIKYFSLWLFLALSLAHVPKVLAGDLSAREFTRFFSETFGVTRTDSRFVVLIDLPDTPEKMTLGWADRNRLAQEWTRFLRDGYPSSFVRLVAYRATGTNNADLPVSAWILSPDSKTPQSLQELSSQPILVSDIFESTDIIIALTQFSATAPLKVAASKYLFRGGTLPGFSRAMAGAFRINTNEINRRCETLRKFLSDALSAELTFEVRGKTYTLTLDLRYREAHSSGGLIREKGKVANLPGGESYKVPYEGERDGEPSLSRGILPVEYEDEIVLYHIEGNRAVEILSQGPKSEEERVRIATDPVLGNIAEFGWGILESLGMQPLAADALTPEPVLINEKLGVHIAFGRSEHLGGKISPSAFRDQSTVFHYDHIFIPTMQPNVLLRSVALTLSNGSRVNMFSTLPRLFSKWPGNLCAAAITMGRALRNFISGAFGNAHQ